MSSPAKNPTDHRHQPDVLGDKLARDDAALIAPPPTGRNTPNAHLHHVVRLLLLAHGSAERRIVAGHVYRGEKLSAVAASMGLPVLRAQEMLDSLRTRERTALAQLANETKLARWQAQERRAAARKEKSDNG